MIVLLFFFSGFCLFVFEIKSHSALAGLQSSYYDHLNERTVGVYMTPHLLFVLLEDALLQHKCGLRESIQFQSLKINFCPQTLLGMLQSIETLRVYFILFYFIKQDCRIQVVL